MELELRVELGYRPTMGRLMDAIEQAHLAGFGDRDCTVNVIGDSRRTLVVQREVTLDDATSTTTEDR
jgi:hypothetical protein